MFLEFLDQVIEVKSIQFTLEFVFLTRDMLLLPLIGTRTDGQTRVCLHCAWFS